MKDKDLFEMVMEENRLNSFKKWPFKEPNKCTKEKMAAAGFYFQGSRKEPDLVACFVCLKEMDGWEEDDDPWEEHKSHTVNCGFIKTNKSELTYADVRELEKQRSINIIKKSLDSVLDEFVKQAEKTRKVLEEIG